MDAESTLVSRTSSRPRSDHGSAAGELAACVRGVGLADRRDLGLLSICGPAATLRDAGRLLAGVDLAVGGTASLQGSWWCRSQEELFVIGPRAPLARTAGVLHAYAGRAPALSVRDLSASTVAIGLLGARMAELLEALGLLAERHALRDLAPFTAVRVAGSDVRLLLQSDRRALLVVGAEHAGRVWAVSQGALRELHGSLVGLDATRRFELLDRRARRDLVAHPELLGERR